MSPGPPPPPRLLRDVREGYPRLSGSGGRGRLRPHATWGRPGRPVAGLSCLPRQGSPSVTHMHPAPSPVPPFTADPRARASPTSPPLPWQPAPPSPTAHTHSPRPAAPSQAQHRGSPDGVEQSPRWRLRPHPLRTPGWVRAPPHAARALPRPS